MKIHLLPSMRCSKYLFVAIFLLILNVIGSIHAQANSFDETRLTLRVDKMNILQVFKEIEKKTAYKFTYNDAFLNDKMRVTMSMENRSLTEILAFLSKEVNLEFKQVKKHIHVIASNDRKTSFLGGESVQSIKVAGFPVKGKVTSGESGDGIPGASVLIKGTNKGTVTNALGEFSMEVDNEATVLVFSSIGYVSKEIAVAGRKLINVNLLSDVKALDEVVVVGYGTQKAKDLTGSVGIVKVDDAKKTASYDVAKLLQGQVPGVTVQSSGEPGGFVNIKIRGIGSLTNNNPLFVIDGVLVDSPFDFSTNDIESISVLKDASAGAIYGSRGMNGVVIITTKKGKAGPLKVDYNAYAGVQNIAKTISVMDRVGYQNVVSAAELNAGLTIAPANDPTNPAYISKVNTNWQKEGLKTGYIQDHNLSFSGGSETIKASASLGFFNNSSTVTGPQNYKRYTFNGNISGKKGIFSFGAKIGYTNSEKIGAENTREHAVFGGAITSLLTAIPTMSVYDENRLGGFGGADKNTQRAITLNVIGMNSLLKGTDTRNRFLGSVFGELELLKNLKYKLQLSADRIDTRYLFFEPKYDLGFYYLTPNAYLFEKRENNLTTLAENTLNYSHEFGKHKIEALAGYTFQQGVYSRTEASAKGLVEPYVLNMNTAVNTANGKSVTGWDSKATLSSVLARLNYNYADKYLLTVNYRRDGSSKFRAENRYGNFASVGVAWNVHNDIELPEAISSLKLRGGYGALGNQNVGDYLTDTYINTNTGYVFGGVLAPGAIRTQVVDPSIRWESKRTTNAAMELGLFRDRVSFSVEYYDNRSYDVLANIPIPTSVGATNGSILTNAASLSNSGLEFTASYRQQTGDFKYAVSANFHTLSNKVLALGGTNNPIYGAASKTEVGQPIGQIFGYVSEGIFQNADDVKNHATQTNAAPGDVKFKDLNGDKVITSDDRTYLGNTIPTFYFGTNFNASYKNFDFSAFIQGSGGNKIYNGMYRDLMGLQYSNGSTDALNYWTPSNTNTNVPRPIIGDPNSNGRDSDRFVENGTYLRLQNAQLGYTLPTSIVNKLKVSKVRFYVSGQNLFLVSGFKGFDPDFMGESDGLFSRGYYNGSYPNPRAVLLGVQVGF
ncbi:TonB-linked SusC/RagA family outer membrane protein [Arcicella rosea]|uniref:SusC/RagA family TonB-linked outer membrane protein n=1 Tax=Arcicella rosea TaxID=502909 RepID=UPI00345DF54D